VAPPSWPAPLLHGLARLPALAGAAAEIGGGVVMMAAPEPVASKVAGAVLIAHGLDSMWSAATGSRSHTAQGAERMARAAGADKDTAETIGTVADIAVPILAGGLGKVASGRGKPSLSTEGKAAGAANDAKAGKLAPTPKPAPKPEPNASGPLPPPPLVDPIGPAPTSSPIPPGSDPFDDAAQWTSKGNKNFRQNTTEQFLYVLEDESGTVAKYGTAWKPKSRYTPSIWTKPTDAGAPSYAELARDAYAKGQLQGRLRMRILARGNASTIKDLETRLLVEYEWLNGRCPPINRPGTYH
jgi:hypothetical protein